MRGGADGTEGMSDACCGEPLRKEAMVCIGLVGPGTGTRHLRTRVTFFVDGRPPLPRASDSLALCAVEMA